MKKRDIIALTAMAVVAAALAVVGCALPIGHHTGRAVCAVYVDGKRVAAFPFDADREYEIITENGTNLLVISDGKAYIAESDCKNLVCVHSGYLTADSSIKPIVCKPHKVTVCTEYE
ncbi:MAG: NusG domain II-containing protein [Clostridia bacterium]|nr:NusG domain II-containing protein [Clostridia bacterium]